MNHDETVLLVLALLGFVLVIGAIIIFVIWYIATDPAGFKLPVPSGASTVFASSMLYYTDFNDADDSCILAKNEEAIGWVISCVVPTDSEFDSCTFTFQDVGTSGTDCTNSFGQYDVPNRSTQDWSDTGNENGNEGFFYTFYPGVSITFGDDISPAQYTVPDIDVNTQWINITFAKDGASYVAEVMTMDTS